MTPEYYDYIKWAISILLALGLGIAYGYILKCKERGKP